MRAAIVAMLVLLLLPAALCAGPMLGVYFTYTPAQMHYSPVQFENFYGYVYFTNPEGCYLNAIEFKVSLPTGITIDSWTCDYPDLTIGEPNTGISMVFNPPYLPGEGYNLILTMTLYAKKFCVVDGGTLQDAAVRVLPHPESGFLRGSCYPSNELVDIAGLTSIICPFMIGTEEHSWGAIKSLF